MRAILRPMFELFSFAQILSNAPHAKLPSRTPISRQGFETILAPLSRKLGLVDAGQVLPTAARTASFFVAGLAELLGNLMESELLRG